MQSQTPPQQKSLSISPPPQKPQQRSQTLPPQPQSSQKQKLKLLESAISFYDAAIPEQEKKTITNFFKSIYDGQINQIGKGSYGTVLTLSSLPNYVFKIMNDELTQQQKKKQLQTTTRTQQVLNKVQQRRQRLGGKVIAVFDPYRIPKEKWDTQTMFLFPCVVMKQVTGQTLNKLNKSQNLEYWDHVVIDAVQVLETIALLQSSTPSLVHGDLNLGNILYDHDQRKMTMIDFGFLMPTSDLIKKLTDLGQFFYIYPFLLTRCISSWDENSFSLWISLFSDVLQKFSNQYVLDSTFLENFFKIFKDDDTSQKLDLTKTETTNIINDNQLLSAYETSPVNCTIILDEKNLKKFDLYSFAVCLLFCLPHEYLQKRSALLDLLFQMVHPNPEIQPSPENIVKEWNKMLRVQRLLPKRQQQRTQRG